MKNSFTHWKVLMILVVVGLLTSPVIGKPVRLDAQAMVAQADGVGVKREHMEVTIGTRTIKSEVVRLDPGDRLPLTLEFGDTAVGHGWFLALQRFVPDELQKHPLSFSLQLNETPLYEVYGMADPGGGPFDTVVVPVPSGSQEDQWAIVNTSDVPLFLSDLVVYDQVAINPAMDLYFLAGGLSNESQLTRSIHSIPIDTAPGQGSGVGVSVNWPFLSTLTNGRIPADAIDMEIGFDRALALAQSHNLKLNVKLTSDWGGWPVHINDGLGGRFGDLEYQQIMYSSHHVRETDVLRPLLGHAFAKEYGLTTPNRWSNTPWLTYNHPRLNAFLVEQYGKVAGIYDRLYERWILEETSIPVAPLSTGTESLYWARENDRGMDDFVFSGHNDGIDRDPLWADFNPYVIEAALADGIELNPQDGLSNQEREWLHHNLARHTQMLVDAMYGAQKGSILEIAVDGSLKPIVAPRHQMYTEPYGYPFYPLWDDARPMMSVGIVQGARPGTQWYTTTFIPYLRKQRELGYTANPNFEWTGIQGVEDAVASLRAAYALGNEFVTFYNWTNDVDRLSQVLERYARDFPIAWNYQGRLRLTGGDTYRQVFRPRGELHLINLLDVQASATPTQPVTVKISRRVFLSEETLMTFRVPVEHVKALADGFIRLQLPTIWLPTDTNYVLEIESNGWTLSEEPEVRVGLDMALERGHGQLIQARGEALRLLELVQHNEGRRLTWTGLNANDWQKQAESLIAAGQYQEAVEALWIADGLILPARFHLKAGKVFGFPWGAGIETFQSAILTIEEVQENADQVEIALTLRQADPKEQTITVSSLEGTIDVTTDAEGVSVTEFDGSTLQVKTMEAELSLIIRFNVNAKK